MCETPETFLTLTGTDWTGLSAVATFAAVVVALFIPFIQECRQKTNILALIKKELDDNYSRLVKTENWSDQEINGQKISALHQKIAMAEHIKLKIWSEFKYKLAVNNPEEYQKYSELNDILERITDYRNEFNANLEPQKSRATREIEKEISLFINKRKVK